VNGESFGFDTIRIKENNLRIKAQDTSTSASFPSNDWQITFNDSANGGANKFSIDDVSGGRTPLTIEAGAPSHSLYVDDGGRLGLGTSTPVADVHVKSGNTPTLRLEQDGSSGFSAQTWDVAGNETNFFVRDATNGSTLPIRLRPGAPTSSLDIAADGDIGIGTSSPGTLTTGEDAAVHIRRTDGTGTLLIEDAKATTSVITMLELRNGNGSRIYFEDTRNDTNDWIAGSNTSQFQISEVGSGQTEFLLDVGGDLAITGTLTTGGVTCGGGCDLVFSEDYVVESIEDHAKKMWENQFLPNIGPTVEGEPFNLSDKTGRMLNELEKAHIYIEQLHNRLSEKEDAIAEINEKLEQLEMALTAR
jgi:hypothetical protein